MLIIKKAHTKVKIQRKKEAVSVRIKLTKLQDAAVYAVLRVRKSDATLLDVLEALGMAEEAHEWPVLDFGSLVWDTYESTNGIFKGTFIVRREDED